MRAFLNQLYIQFRGDLRDKGVLIVYYLMPMAFYVVMGSIFNLPELGMGNSVITSLTIFAISMAAFLGMPQILVRARENGVLQAYRAAGIPAWSLPMATVIISFVHMMIISCVILFTAPFLFGADWPVNLPLHLGGMALVIICSQALGTLLACLVKKQNAITLLSQCLFMPTILMSGIMFPARMLPEAMQHIGQVLPATQGAKLIVDGSLKTTPLIVLASLTVAGFAVSVVLFRRISMKA